MKTGASGVGIKASCCDLRVWAHWSRKCFFHLKRTYLFYGSCQSDKFLCVASVGHVQQGPVLHPANLYQTKKIQIDFGIKLHRNTEIYVFWKTNNEKWNLLTLNWVCNGKRNKNLRQAKWEGFCFALAYCWFIFQHKFEFPSFFKRHKNQSKKATMIQGERPDIIKQDKRRLHTQQAKVSQLRKWESFTKLKNRQKLFIQRKKRFVFSTHPYCTSVGQGQGLSLCASGGEDRVANTEEKQILTLACFHFCCPHRNSKTSKSLKIRWDECWSGTTKSLREIIEMLEIFISNEIPGIESRDLPGWCPSSVLWSSSVWQSLWRRAHLTCAEQTASCDNEAGNGRRISRSLGSSQTQLQQAKNGKEKLNLLGRVAQQTLIWQKPVHLAGQMQSCVRKCTR